jgi:two-component system NtrC family response regulator
MDKLTILVVEDDALSRKVMTAHLAGHTVEFAHDKAAALRKLQTLKPDICFIDLNLGDGDDCSGLELIPVTAARGIYSVVMSGQDSEPVVERAYALGCDDFYAKGNEEANVGRVLERFAHRRDAMAPDLLFKERFITDDPATRAAIGEALRYADSELPVLILGPSGTGKTSLASVIHDRSGGAASSWPSTAPPTARTSWKPSFSATAKARSRARTTTARDACSPPTAARFSSTRSAR